MTRTIIGIAALLATTACADSRPTAPGAARRADADLAAARSGPRCHPVEGTIIERITGPNTAAGKVTGDISGDVDIVITALQQLPGGLVKFQANCTMVTPQGTLTTNDDAVLSPIDAPCGSRA